MHIVYLNYYFDEAADSSEELLRRYHSTVEWCKAVKRAGANRVSVVQRFHTSSVERIDGADFHFVSDKLPPQLQAWHHPSDANRYVKSLGPDIIHENGSVLSFMEMSSILPDQTAIVWQYHGGPPPTFPKSIFHRQAFGQIDAFFFTSTEQARAWRQIGLIRDSQSVYEIVEASSTFKPASQMRCRSELRLKGKEIFLWVGRLNQNKDPISVLQGFARIVPLCTAPSLYMIYTADDLLEQVRQKIQDLKIDGHVQLLGSVPHEHLRHYHSAADYFVLGSHNEGSGYALLEALACGVTPIVTDIPSFRKITDNGQVGALWGVGDPDSFVAAFRRLMNKKHSRRSIRDYFNKRLSYDVLGKEALQLYSEVFRQKRENGR